MATSDDTTMKPKRRGRPSKGKRGTFSFRVTDALRTKLEAEAATSGRPVSEEIELRLEQSFVVRQLLMEMVGDEIAALVGGRQNLALLVKLSDSIAVAAYALGQDNPAAWAESENVRVKVEKELVEAIPHLLRHPPAPFASVAEEVGSRRFTKAWNAAQIGPDVSSEGLDTPPSIERTAWLPDVASDKTARKITTRGKKT